MEKKYLVQGFEIFNYQIKDFKTPSVMQSDKLKSYLLENNLITDNDFKLMFKEALYCFSQSYKPKIKSVDTWLDRTQNGIGIVVWNIL